MSLCIIFANIADFPRINCKTEKAESKIVMQIITYSYRKLYTNLYAFG